MKTLTALPILEDEVVRCVPFGGNDDFEYLFNICAGCKWTKVDKDSMRSLFATQDGYYWTVYAHGKLRSTALGTDIKGGVIYFTKTQPDNKTWFHAYRADSLCRMLLEPNGHHSYRAAKMLLEYAAKEISDTGDIYTMHAVDNRAATMLCMRLGFVEEARMETKFGEFIVMVRKEKKWGLKHRFLSRMRL